QSHSRFGRIEALSRGSQQIGSARHLFARLGGFSMDRERSQTRVSRPGTRVSRLCPLPSQGFGKKSGGGPAAGGPNRPGRNRGPHLLHERNSSLPRNHPGPVPRFDLPPRLNHTFRQHRLRLRHLILVAPASFDFAQDKPCRLSRGRLALGATGELRPPRSTRTLPALAPESYAARSATSPAIPRRKLD